MNTPVSFELAKLLKEKGFDIPVRNYFLIKEKGEYIHEGFENDYWGDNRIVNWNKDTVGIKPFGGFISAPTIAEVVMWLYEKHKIWVVLLPKQKDKGLFWGVFYSEINKQEFSKSLGSNFSSPTEAYEVAIEYILKNLL
jgi:hypothetical protein